MGSFLDLIFAHCFVVLQRLLNLWRRRPKDGSLQVSRKAKDGSLRLFHVQAHAEFAFVPNSADLCVFWVCSQVCFSKGLCFQLSFMYQFGLLLYCSHFSIKIEWNKCVGS